MVLTVAKQIFIIAAFAAQSVFFCDHTSGKQSQAARNMHSKAVTTFRITTDYQSENLIIRKLSDHVYLHTSFLNTESFGKVPCNGMIVVNDNEALVFDTPSSNETSQELISYITVTLECKINAVVATHFHTDCLGGLEQFHKNGIPSYANDRTIDLAKANRYVIPQNGFDSLLVLNAGNKNVLAEYPGEGHTKDNIIGYFLYDKILFGGCLVKELGAGKGNLEDANVEVWAETVRKIKLKYPQTKGVIPGHGEPGGIELLDFTISLFD